MEFLVRLFLLSSSSSVDYCGGKVDRRPNIQACVDPSSSCLLSSHAIKAETFERNHLYIRTPPKFGRLTVYLDLSVSVSDLSDDSPGFLLAQEFSVKFWSSLLPRIVSCTQEDIEDLVQSLHGSTERRVDFITPKKRLKTGSNITNLAFSFPLDVFQKITSGFSFKESLALAP